MTQETGALPHVSQHAAISTARYAATAATGLLEHAREGAGFGDVDVVGDLARALIDAIPIQRSLAENCDLEFIAGLAALREEAEHYLRRFAA